jgi:hypothetical protein
LFFGSAKVFSYLRCGVGGFVLGVELSESSGGYFEVVGCVFYCYVVLFVLLQVPLELFFVFDFGMCFNCVVGYFLEGVWVWLLSCLCGLVVNSNIVQKEEIILGQDTL